MKTEIKWADVSENVKEDMKSAAQGIWNSIADDFFIDENGEQDHSLVFTGSDLMNMGVGDRMHDAGGGYNTTGHLSEKEMEACKIFRTVNREDRDEMDCDLLPGNYGY